MTRKAVVVSLACVVTSAIVMALVHKYAPDFSGFTIGAIVSVVFSIGQRVPVA